jgi:uncharacterized protein (DUF1778 family)
MYQSKDHGDERDDEPDRINMRTTVRIKRMLQEAANIQSHGDLSAFMLQCAEERAATVIRSLEESELRAEDRKRFYEFLLDPPEPSQALIELFAQRPSEQFRVVH